MARQLKRSKSSSGCGTSLIFLGKEGYAVSTKAAAQAVGVDLGVPRAPYGELQPEKLDELRKLIADTGLNYS